MFDFLTLKKSIESISQKYRALMAERDALRIEITQTKNAPTHRSDITNLAKKWVEKTAAGFDGVIHHRMRTAFDGGATTPFDFGFFAAMKDDSGSITHAAMDSALCAAFPDAITAALAAAINSRPVENEGLPAAEREAKLAKLADREKELTNELLALTKSADEAGIEL